MKANEKMMRQQALQTAKPILFNTEMVKAILNGTKTATRRLIKPQPRSKLSYCFAGKEAGKWSYPSKNAYKSWGDEFKLPLNISDEDLKKYWTAPYHADDILYVRETWAELETVYGHLYYAYKADDDILHHSIGENFTHWHPSIHMPKEAARIFLRVTDVRVERLQDIDGYAVLAEGVDNGSSNPTMGKRWENMQRMAYSMLWNSTVKQSDLSKYGWNANPWVWVIEFERISKEEAYNG